MISNTDTDCDPYPDPDIEGPSRLIAKLQVIHGTLGKSKLCGWNGREGWAPLARGKSACPAPRPWDRW